MDLNVGCGIFSESDVNVDLYIDKTVHRPSGIYAKKIPNFIRCDGHFLPFRDNIFNKVVSYHVIEHVSNPFMFVKEMVRVSKRLIEIKCPHLFGEKFFNNFLGRKNFGHKWLFRGRWFIEVGKNLYCESCVNVSQYFFIFPLELHVKYLVSFGI